MVLSWKILLFLNISFFFLTAIRFYKSRYFIYFMILSLMDPIYILAHYIFDVNGYYYMPVALTISLLFIPGNNKKHIILALICTILLIPYFIHVSILPILLSTVASTYLIYFFIEELMNEYKKSSSLLLFIPVMILNILKDNLKIYLYFLHNDILTNYFTWFLIVGAILPLLICYFGPSKKIKPYLNSKKNSSYEEENFSGLRSFQQEIKNTIEELTEAETKILSLLATGCTSKEIANKLFVSPKTVYFHTSNLKSKLNIDSTNRLVLYAKEKQFDTLGKTHTGKSSSTEFIKN